MPTSDPEVTAAVPGPARSGPATGKDRLEELSRAARPAEVSDSGRRRVLEDWEKATRVVAQAKQMVKDAIRTQNQMAEQVVRKLGRGNLRYKDVLYSPSAKGDTIYLRELVRKPNG